MKALSFSVSPRASRRLVALLAISAVALCLLSVGAGIMYLYDLPGSRMAVALFSVDEETSVPTWFATVVLFTIALTTAAIGYQYSVDRRSLTAWWALAAGFLFLSVDEAAEIHERVGYLIGVDGVLHDARWIVVWLPMAALVGLPILWQLWKSSRQLVVGLIAGAVVFLSGAVGAEIVNSHTRQIHRLEMQAQDLQESLPDDRARPISTLDSHADQQSYAYLLGSNAEELLEMLGSIIWFAVVLRVGLHGPATESLHKQPDRIDRAQRSIRQL